MRGDPHGARCVSERVVAVYRTSAVVHQGGQRTTIHGATIMAQALQGIEHHACYIADRRGLTPLGGCRHIRLRTTARMALTAPNVKVPGQR